MSKITKKILGSLFFATVAVTTGIATTIPRPSAYAVSDSSSVQINVVVPTYSYSLSITSPTSPLVTKDQIVPINVTYSNSHSILIYLCNKDTVPGECTAANSTHVTSLTPTTPNTGTINNVMVTLPSFGHYQIWAQGYDQTTNTLMPQKPFVDVTYEHSLSIVPDSPGAGNPTGKIYFDLETCYINILIYDENNDLVREIRHEPTQEERAQGYYEYEFPLDQPFESTDDESGQANELPPLEKGSYKVVVQSTDCSGEVLEEVAINIDYQPIEPPKTGTINILGLTISRVDYLITGIIGFLAVAIFGLYLIRRKSHRQTK
jgi:hypothetical protein